MEKILFVDKVATLVVVIHEATRHMLFVQKADGETNAGKWLFPGGKMDENDIKSPSTLFVAELCAIRELKEETGLKASYHNLVYLLSFSATVPNNKKDDKSKELTYFSNVYLVKVANKFIPELQLNELSGYVWMSSLDAGFKLDLAEAIDQIASIADANSIDTRVIDNRLTIGELKDE